MIGKYCLTQSQLIFHQRFLRKFGGVTEDDGNEVGCGEGRSSRRQPIEKISKSDMDAILES